VSVSPWKSWAPVPCTGCTYGSYGPGRNLKLYYKQVRFDIRRIFLAEELLIVGPV